MIIIFILEVSSFNISRQTWWLYLNTQNEHQLSEFPFTSIITVRSYHPLFSLRTLTWWRLIQLWYQMVSWQRKETAAKKYLRGDASRLAWEEMSSNAIRNELQIFNKRQKIAHREKELARTISRMNPCKAILLAMTQKKSDGRHGRAWQV
jgi:hypothetical protein